MCGIAGFWHMGSGNDPAATIARMTGAIAHRGPDDSGAWLDPDVGLALGHRRLSIIDLSPGGHQPMTSASGRFVTTYNGEIYNFADLKTELEQAGAAPAWRGHSDTEIMVAGFDHWGIEHTLGKLIGMFALAVWDKAERTLTLARDRMGEKPLYYGTMGDAFLFGSELKALAAHPRFRGTVDRGAVAAYFRYSYVPNPLSIWQGISKLPPGCLVAIRDGGRTVGEPVAYWRLADAIARGSTTPLDPDGQWSEDLEWLLRDAVQRQMAADVPVGAFLSGGIDSSLIVSLMQTQSARAVKTYTIGFDDARFNEAHDALAVARHLGTDHTALQVTAADAIAVVPDLPKIWDEPFADSSQIPTFLVSKLAAGHVTVSLSGDGGDELFGGYNRYLKGMQLWNAAHRFPRPVRKGAAAILGLRGSQAIAESVNASLPMRHRQLGLSDRMSKAANMIAQDSREAAYLRMVSHRTDPEALLVGGREPDDVRTGQSPAFDDFRHAMMYRDSMTYLPDDILTKVDRASMAVSLEARVPFLDHRVVEFAWRLPMSAKIRGTRGKHILREILSRHVPDAIIDRPKTGFAVPIGDWLVGPLRDWAETLLDERRLRQEGFLDAAAVRRMWDRHRAGHPSQAHELWDVLMFQAWLERDWGFASAPLASVA